MKIIPVIDVLDGIVVRGIAGQRDSYRAVESCLTPSRDVVDVAESLREHFDRNSLYVADLDAILHDRPHFEIYSELAKRGFDLAVDAGLRDVGRAERLIRAGVQSVIAGLETIPGAGFLRELCVRFGPDSIIFSLDLKNGVPLMGAGDAFAEGVEKTTRGSDHDTFAAVREIVDQAYESGIRRMIVLDLAAVGVGGGVATVELCRKIGSRYPGVELITGGGIRNVDDLRQLRGAGIHGALVASALHNGSITPEQLEEFQSSES